MLTWTTHDRERLIDVDGAAFLSRFLRVTAKRHGAEVLAMGVVADQLHLVLHLHQAVDVPRLVQGLKGASARVGNRDGVFQKRKLRWAQGYDLRSISPGQLHRAIRYVQTQVRQYSQCTQLSSVVQRLND